MIRRLALFAAAAATTAAAAAGAAPGAAAAPAYAGSGTCTIPLHYGEAIISYATQATVFGATTHVSFVTTGDAYQIAFDRLWVPGNPHPLRGITGIVDADRGWNAGSWLAPHALSVGVVDAVTGESHGWRRC